MSRTKGLPDDRVVAFDDEVIDEHLRVAQSMPRVRKPRFLYLSPLCYTAETDPNKFTNND